MVGIELSLDGQEATIRALQERGESIPGIVEPPIHRGAIRVEGALKFYPSPPGSGEWAAKTTPAQKRAFFAKAKREGYTGRTGNYGQRWTTQPISGVSMVGREVGNNTPYGPYVGSSELQARMHEGRWPTDIEVMGANADDIIQDVTDSLTRALG